LFGQSKVGVTALSIGVGAAYPPANLIAKPFVCPNGQMTLDQQVSNPLPGTTYTIITWYCVDERSGVKTELDIFPMSLYAGAIYGFLLFVLVVIIWAWVKRKDLALTNTDQTSARTDTAAIQSIRHNSPAMDEPRE
jgi:hypothetical protein